MTDITELAQRLKAAADREMICRDVAETSEIWERTVTPENILSLVEALEKSEKTSEARREAIDITHKRAARERDRANAAEEALEKAQGMETYWKTQCRGITDHCEELQARIAELDAELEREREKTRCAMSRIAELESRTVKLPAERFCPAEYAGSQLWSETEVWNKAITACADELRAAGIKVEVK
ncbi:TPA: hypothetical protein L9X63_002941 [Klebsiella pneumoniae]|nr:hypothetical protein [Klebsiella pneumoniae]